MPDTVTLNFFNGTNGRQRNLGVFNLTDFDSASLSFTATDQFGSSQIYAWVRTGTDYATVIDTDTLSTMPSIHSGTVRDFQLTDPADVEFWVQVNVGIVFFSDITIRGWREP